MVALPTMSVMLAWSGQWERLSTILLWIEGWSKMRDTLGCIDVVAGDDFWCIDFRVTV